MLLMELHIINHRTGVNMLRVEKSDVIQMMMMDDDDDDDDDELSLWYG